jgi:hypothetical protein
MPIRRAAALACIAVLLLLLPGSGVDARRPTLPARIDDATFWRLFTEYSEPGGTFRSENLVSNERAFPAVLPKVAERASRSSAYIGVGPEQNFSYLAALKPRVAFIVDIRRQNAVLHLLYKAIFELSPTRAEFLSRLFSRPRARHLGPGASPRELMEAFAIGTPSADAFAANLEEIRTLLTVRHGWPIGEADLAGVKYVYEAFFESGPDIRYSMRSFRRGRPFPNFAELMTATDDRGGFGSFLADEARYRAVRDLQVRNLVIPVVGDFAGERALAAVGGYLREHGLVVTAFYASNVEQYLFRGDGWETFARNLSALPINGRSVLVRSVFSGFGQGWPGGSSTVPGPGPGGLGAPGARLDGQIQLDPIGDLLAAVRRGAVGSYADLVARPK